MRAWIGSTHPGPTLAVTIVTVALSIGAGLDAARTTLLALAIFANQLSVGLSNDWLDAQRDIAVGRTDKPIATGAISVGAVRTSAWITAALSVLLTLPLGWPVVVAQAVFLLSGWHYNAWLKNTPFSVVPFIVGFGVLPATVTLALGAAPAWWAVGAGALLGVAAHFANVLPDLADDDSTGIRGLPHRVGRVATGLVIAGALAGASTLLFIGLPDALHAAGLALGLALAAVCAALVLRGVATRLLFRLIIAAALLDVGLLAVSGGALVA